MRRFFRIVLGALAMMSVALLSALATMRLAIHGIEVSVPNLTGLTLARPEPGSRPPNDNLPITAWPKTPGQSKPKAK